MGILKPLYPVRSNQVIELNRDNPFDWTFSQDAGRKFAFGASGFLTFKNTFGQAIDSWEGDANAKGDLSFFAEATATNNIPAGTAWTLTVDLNDGSSPRLFAQGTVVRAEAVFPNAADAPPPTIQPLQFSYSFGSPGFVFDPAWRILQGNPNVYDNSSLTRPNSVASGALDPSVYADAVMLYYSPLNTDSVRIKYNIVKSVGGISDAIGGETLVVICSSYDMNNSTAIYHKQFTGSGDTVGIATGTGPTTFALKQSVSHTTSTVENFTAEYNPSSNTFAVYAGTSTSPLVSWVDSTNIVHHGAGERYVGFSFHAAGSGPGVSVSDWFAADAI